MNHLEERIFYLEAVDKEKRNSGLLTDKNQLVAYQDGRLWLLRFKAGGVIPEPLRTRFTNFNSLVKHLTTYLATRNLKIASIID